MKQLFRVPQSELGESLLAKNVNCDGQTGYTYLYQLVLKCIATQGPFLQQL